MRTISPSDIRLFVYTEREGVLKKVGHDLKLAFSVGSVEREGSAVRAVVDAGSVSVAGSLEDGAVKSVGLMDRKVIERNAAKDVLRVKKHPTIRFDGEATPPEDAAFTLDGELQILGKAAPFSMSFEKDAAEWVGRGDLDQTRWGIEPYTAFMGALKIRPVLQVEVRFDAGLLG